MHTPNIRELLSTFRFFENLPPAALDNLALSMHWQHLDRGAVLFHQGDEADLAYVVVSGRLRLVQHTADGKDITMANFTVGDVIGLIMILTNESYPGTCEVLEASTVLTLSGPPTWDLLNGNAPFGVSIIRLLSAHLLEAHNRIRELSTERVQQRVARSILRLVEKVGVPDENGSIRLDIRLSRQDLAQMNGTTLETISRTLSGWESDGIIASHREQIVVLQPHQMAKLADDLPH
jgi:CRP-like cAMP-binding protein